MTIHQITNHIKKQIVLISLPRITVIAFILLQIVGMKFYPGGTIHNPDSIGYSFSENFFSDMGAYVARNGEPNYLSMIIFAFSLTIASITYVCYYLVLPKMLGNDKLNYFFACIGSIFAFGGSICLICTGLTPTDLVFESHVFFANNIFHCFLMTAFFYSLVIFRSKLLSKRYAMGYGLFFLAILVYIGVLQFGPSVHSGQKALVLQVVSQKMIVIIFLISVVHQSFGFEKLEKL